MSMYDRRSWLRRTGYCALIGLGSLGLSVTTEAADPYYQDKTITFIIGYAPGGGSDLTGRLFARHLGDHIEGKPNIIVKNMPGAGAIVALNYVGNAAAPDGQTVFWGTGPVLQQLLDDPALKTDLSKFAFIAGTPGNQVFYARTDIGIKEPVDIFAAKGLSVAGFHIRSNKDIAERLALDVLGIDFKYVTGFKGNSQARAAVQQSLANGFLEGLPSYLGITVPTMVKIGMVTPIYQLGVPKEEGVGQDRDPVVSNVPTVAELYNKKYGKDPSGTLWEAYVAVTAPYAVSQRFLAAPPGTPEEAVSALRAAIGPMSKDPAFHKEMLKVIKYDLPVYPGKRAESAIREALGASSKVKAILNKMVAEGKKGAVR